MAKKSKEPYIVYTDGSALGNPGPGGYGAIIRHGKKEIVLSKGYKLTTNNRCEILAVIATLEELGPGKRVHILSDSQYTIDGATKWIHGWRRNNWMTRDGGQVKNKDLWIRLQSLLRENSVKFFKVKAHVGIEGNEKADMVAKAAAANPTDIDVVYESL